MIKAAITGIEVYIPDDVITNEDLAKMVDTSDDWIMSRIGIKKRPILKGEGKGTSSMGIVAVKELLRKTNTNPKDIDLIICATATPDFQIPATAALIAEACGITNSFGFDLNAACSGFIYSLEVASNSIKSGNYKKVLIVSGDKMTSVTNYSDRTTCALFSDAVGAVLLEPNTEGNGIINASLYIDGIGASSLGMKGGGSAYPATEETIKQQMHYLVQDGQVVFKNAVASMTNVSKRIMEINNLTADDVTWFVPHQANKRIIDAIKKELKLPEEKIMVNIHKYGNCSAGTIPLCLWEWENQLKKGDNLILMAFGAGFTWGAVYLKWAY